MVGWGKVRLSVRVWEGERGNDRGVGTAWADKGYGCRKGGVGVSVVNRKLDRIGPLIFVVCQKVAKVAKVVFYFYKKKSHNQ